MKSISDYICPCLSFQNGDMIKTCYTFTFRWFVVMRWYWICAHLLINRWHQRATYINQSPHCLVKGISSGCWFPRRTRSQLSSRWPMLMTALFMECFEKNLPHPLSLSNNLVYASTFFFIYLYPLFLCHLKTYSVKAVYVTWNWDILNFIYFTFI